MSFKHADAVKTFKALADDNRLEIMRLLIDGEKCGCALLRALEIGQPTLSHHMHILCDAGLVDAHKKGTWMQYSISEEGAIKIRNLVDHYVVYSDQRYSDTCCVDLEKNNQDVSLDESDDDAGYKRKQNN